MTSSSDIFLNKQHCQYNDMNFCNDSFDFYALEAEEVGPISALTKHTLCIELILDYFIDFTVSIDCDGSFYHLTGHFKTSNCAIQFT